MSNFIFESENELMSFFLKSGSYHYFKNFELERKIKREAIAWLIISQNKDTDFKEILDHFFNIVSDSNNLWFGSIFRPNRNLIFNNAPEKIRNFMYEILFSNHDLKTKIDLCLDKAKLKIEGVRHGLVTLLLYLSNPDEYNIWLPQMTEPALCKLNRLQKLPDKNWGEHYIKFNDAANKFKKEYSLSNREIDWILSKIFDNAEGDGKGKFNVSSKMFEQQEVNLSLGYELYMKKNNIRIEIKV